MSSMKDALIEEEKDNALAAESNARLGIKRGMSVTITGDVYFAGSSWTVKDKSAEVVDAGYPSTAFVRFQDGTRGYVLKTILTKVTP